MPPRARTTPLCRRPPAPPATRRLLLAAPARFALDTARAIVADPALAITRREPMVLEIRSRGTATLDVDGLLRRLGDGLAPADAEVVRVVADDGVGGVSLATALTAPSLADLARTTAADVDEARAILRSGRHRCHAEYEPIVDLRTAAVTGYEALLRTAGPRGVVSPLAVFAAAASLGVAAEVERVARGAALAGASPGWLGDRRLFVNVDPAAVDDVAAAVRGLDRAVALAGLTPGQVVVELTEGARRRDVARLEHLGRVLHDGGFLVALDDVGTGWSTLEAVVRVHPDVVKIDASIVRAVPDPAATAVITALVAVARSYGAEVVAEGIESPAQRDAVARLGVDLGQGRLFAASAPSTGAEVRPLRAARVSARRPVTVAG